MPPAEASRWEGAPLARPGWTKGLHILSSYHHRRSSVLPAHEDRKVHQCKPVNHNNTDHKQHNLPNVNDGGLLMLNSDG